MSLVRKTASAVASWWSRLVFLLFTRGVLLTVDLVGLLFGLRVLRDLTADTTAITNIAFGMSASLAALSFSCARAIGDSDAHRDRFAYAGERFFHASLLLLLGSALKYAALQLPILESRSGWLARTTPFAEAFAGILVGGLFFWALISAHAGVSVSTKLLWSRLNRYPDWDQFA
jgi:hypothetical protein